MSTDEHLDNLERLRRAAPSRLQTSNRTMLSIIKSLKHLAYSAKQANLTPEQCAELSRIFDHELKQDTKQ